MKKKIRIYIASPYTIGDQAQNVRRQIDCFNELIRLGYFPFAPLWSHFQHMVHPLGYEEWMVWDFTWLESCDCVLRLDGESSGADREVEHAHKGGILVFYSINDIINHYEGDIEPF